MGISGAGEVQSWENIAAPARTASCAAVSKRSFPFEATPQWRSERPLRWPTLLTFEVSRTLHSLKMISLRTSCSILVVYDECWVVYRGSVAQTCMVQVNSDCRSKPSADYADYTDYADKSHGRQFVDCSSPFYCKADSPSGAFRALELVLYLYLQSAGSSALIDIAASSSTQRIHYEN